MRILVLENDPREQDRYRAFLEPDYETAVSADAAHALGLISNTDWPFQLAIVSWEFPGPFSGRELVKRLARARPGVPIIVVSRLLDMSLARNAQDSGASDLVLRPLERGRVRSAVAALLRPPIESTVLDAILQRVIGRTRPLLRALENLSKVISQESINVLIVGETGTGKELLARAIHELGPRPHEPCLAVSITEIPATLLETHLFGCERGAYTGAVERSGLFEECRNGTLFLDEIGEMELTLQAKLLRVLQERVFRRVGGNETRSFQGRLVSATNRDLMNAARSGEFREDLYFRIAAHEVHLPPLRERGEDLWLLVEHFLNVHSGGRRIRLGRESQSLLGQYRYRGNIRELENILREAIARCPGDEILPFHLAVESLHRRDASAASEDGLDLLRFPERLFSCGLKESTAEIVQAFDREYLRRKLEEAGGTLTAAARLAGVDKNTFKRRWEDAGLGTIL
jgi:DNA-binding NtrC family response regulator